jgi:hypothetical protein
MDGSAIAPTTHHSEAMKKAMVASPSTNGKPTHGRHRSTRYRHSQKASMLSPCFADQALPSLPAVEAAALCSKQLDTFPWTVSDPVHMKAFMIFSIALRSHGGNLMLIKV